MIQSLENFGSMAIQGTQVPMYTQLTLFLYFPIFQKKFNFYIKKKKKKQKMKINKQKHVKQSKA